MRFWLSLVVAVCLVGLSEAQNAPASQPPWQAPADAAAKTNPLAGKSQFAAGGKKLFARNCAQCHGTGLGDTRNNAPVLASEQVQKDTDGALFWKITNGNTRTGMPSFSSLPDNQRWQLVLYIRTLTGTHTNEQHAK